MDPIEPALKSQRSVEVTYVPDSDVLKIIKPYGVRGLKVAASPYAKSYGTPKTTRSGRRSVKSTVVKSESEEDESPSDTGENDFNIPTSESEKPTNLFEDEVSGSQVFGFNVAKPKGGMAKKASESVSTVAHQDSSNNPASIPKTPYSLRRNLKKKIKKEADKVEEDLFEWSESDYQPSDSSSSSESNDESSDENALTVTPRKPLIQSSNYRANHPAKRDYVFTWNDYFESQGGGGKKTSDHTLSKLSTPQMGEDQVTSLLDDPNNPSNHKEKIAALNKHTCSFFNRWLYSLREGFNVLVHGLGSKKLLLHWFHQMYLSHCQVLVVNGYFQGLTIKQVLDTLCELIGLKEGESVEEIMEYLNSRKTKPRVFMLVHNIDGPMLRSDKAQTCLSLLASHPRIHLIASIDHINAPLMWDQKKMTRYNFTWEDGTCFLRYKEEISFESSLMVQRSGNLALAALKNVFQSLTNNSRNIFKLILNHHLESSNHNSSGMSFSDLYRACRTNFIVSSDLALRTQLTEFLDHQLLKWKKETDMLTIPVEVNVLKQFKQEIDSDV